jgi:hypothetical protein
MATAPRPGVGRRKDAEQVKMVVNLDDETYVLHPAEVNAKQSGMLRRQAGMTLGGLMDAANEDPDLDVVAMLVWLARLQRGDEVTYDEVAEAITFESDIALGDDAPAEDPHSPEA